jgi:threonine dehydrogenase-like Zn-dependent dehydrogenase
MVIGHEFAGEVTKVGDPAFGHLIGKRVFAEPYNTCGLCEFCRTGRYNLCRNTRHIGHGAGWGLMDYYPGGMAEFCPVWATHVYELPDELSFEEATLLDPLAVAVHAVRLAGVRPGSRALVLGSGPVGLLIAQVVRALGCSTVFCTDIYEKALSIAAAVGVDYPVHAGEADVAALVMEKTDGQGVELVFDTVGNMDSQETARRLLASSGTWVNLVADDQPIPLRLKDFSGERCIRGSSNNLYEDVVIGIRMMASGQVRGKPLITHRLPLSRVGEGFTLMQQKTKAGAVKVIILP